MHNGIFENSLSEKVCRFGGAPFARNSFYLLKTWYCVQCIKVVGTPRPTPPRASRPSPSSAPSTPATPPPTDRWPTPPPTSPPANKLFLPPSPPPVRGLGQLGHRPGQETGGKPEDLQDLPVSIIPFHTYHAVFILASIRDSMKTGSVKHVGDDLPLHRTPTLESKCLKLSFP